MRNLRTCIAAVLRAGSAVAAAAAPPPPSGLSARGTGVSQQISLTWTAVTQPSAVTGYHVYIQASADLSTATPGIYVTGTAYSATGFPDRVPYWFWVASDEGGVGPGLTGTPVSAMAFQRPEAPAVTFTALSYGRGFSAQWDLPTVYGPLNSLGALRIEKVDGNVVSILASFDPSQMGGTVAYLPCGQDLTVQARAWDVFGSSSVASAAYQLRTLCPPVAVSTGLDAVDLSISWTANGAVSYVIRSGTAAGLPDPLPAVVALTASTTSTGTVPKPAQGSGLWARVYAVDAAGVTSAGSSDVELLTAPSGLSALPSNDKVRLQWSPSLLNSLQSVTAYQVYYATFPAPGLGVSGTAQLLVPRTGTATSLQAVTLTGLTPHQSYWASVAAIGGSAPSQAGPSSADLSFTPGIRTPAFSQAQALSASSLSFSWPVADVFGDTGTTYSLYRSTSADLSAAEWVLSTTLTASSGVAPLAPGTPTWYFLGVSSSTGASSELPPSTGAAASLPSLDKPLLSVVGSDNARVRLTWTAVAGADAYQVYRATDFAQMTATAAALSDGRTTGLSYTDFHSVNGVNNVYLVRALLRQGTPFSAVGVLSDPVWVTPTVGIGMPGRYGSLNGVDLAYLTVVAQASQVDLFWTPPEQGSSALTGYQLYRGWSQSALSPIQAFGPSVTAATDPNPPQPFAGLVYVLEALPQVGASARVTGTPGAALPWPAPRAPKATVFNTSMKVALSWTTPSASGTYPLSAYQISRRWLASSPWTSVGSVTTTSLTDDVDKQQGSDPLYRIQAMDTGGGLGLAVTISASLGAPSYSTAVPSVVLSVSATALASAGVPIFVSWTPNALFEGVSSYLVYRDGVFLTETASVGYLDAGSVPGTWYDAYQVQARNAAGLGVSGTALPVYAAPPQPAWVSASASIDPNNNGTLALRLSWQDLGAPSVVDAYDVYAQSGSFTNLSAATLIANDVTSSATAYLGMTASAQTAFVVLAKSGGFWAATPTAVTLTIPPLPGSVSGSTATAQAGGALLSWGASPNAMEYWVFRSTNAVDPTSAPLARVSGLSYSDASALTGTVANYGVAAANSLGHGPVAPLSVTPQSLAPTTVTAMAGYDGSNAFVSLSWSASSILSQSYNIERSTAPGSWTSISTVASPAYADADLAGLTNTALSYRVQGVDLAAGGYIEVGPVKAYLPPSAPLSVSASGSDGSVDLRWAPAPAEQGVTGYALSFVVGGASLTWTAAVAAPLSSYRMSGLLAGTSVNAQVQALNSAGGSAWSGPVMAVANAVGAAPIPLTFVAKVGYAEAVDNLARVSLSWAAYNAADLLLYRSNGPMAVSLASGAESSPAFLTRLAGASNSYLDVAVSEGLPYEYALSALSSAGLPVGESVAVLSGEVTPYRQASPVSISGSAGDSRVDLSWGVPSSTGTYPPAARPYRLHRQKSANAPSSFAAVVDDAGFPLDLSGTSYVDRAVNNGDSYYYFLSQVDARGVETREAEFPRTADGLSHAPMRPQGPRRPPSQVLAVAGSNTVTLRWLSTADDANNGVTYNVYRRKEGEDFTGPLPELFHVGASVNEFAGGVNYVVLTLRDLPTSVSPPQNKQTYYYSIAAVNDLGEGPKSAEIKVAPFQPLDPSGNTATGNKVQLLVVNKKDISLSWGPTLSQASNGGYDLKEYRVYRSLDGGNTFTLVQSIAASLNQTAWTDNATDYGFAYTYRVVPVDTMGNEGFSYEYKTVVIPAATDSVLVFRNAFNPAIGERLPLQFAIQRPGHVWVKIFTLNGEHVATVFNEDVPNAGPEQPYLSELKYWDGRNSEGQLVASGVYLIHMEGPGYRSNARVAVIK